MAGTLRITFIPDKMLHRPMTMAIDLDDDTVKQFERLKPPGDQIPDGRTFEEIIEVIRNREFRKELFVKEATRLGHLLAERMEDAEGWHDESRIEPAKQQLKTGEPHQ
jgi:hypothetical protein